MNGQSKPRKLTLPGILLRLEGAAMLLGAIAAYAYTQGNGWAFVLLLIVPDLALLGYAVNPRVGSVAYDIAHFYALPVIVLAVAIYGSNPTLLHVGLIWFAHISMDRALGLGLKYATEAKETHLQRV
ncbi:MAG: DUF4260 domain-containing protein [Anaerolineae bacterium]|nr:DUF4260 domain-containing protein [Anaerolineae bacterium]